MLANSIAPEIFGLEDVKKALLLQMGTFCIKSFRNINGNA
jgi:DNA replicative helicase MCM subunit Mcm2 (Cdc46/Mcm family)